VIDPAKNYALIRPNGQTNSSARSTFFQWRRLLSAPNAPSGVLYLIDDAPLCVKCCNAMNIRHTANGALAEPRADASDGPDHHRHGRSQGTSGSPAPPWRGRAQIVYNGHRLTEHAAPRISLRLERPPTSPGNGGPIKGQPNEAAKRYIDLTPIWRGNTQETLHCLLQPRSLYSQH
jgi:hypothetical protein